MMHWIIAPILLPLLTGCVLLLLPRNRLRVARHISLLSCAWQLLLAGVLVAQAGTGEIQVYALGNWLPPHGIVLVLDRLAALMLLTTAILALPVIIFATAGADSEGHYFHPLFQLQLFGINGAFLTGDLFNLFVFFEILLIASYGLLVHGRSAERVRAGLQYTVLNLVGSALFLVAIGTLYGLTGTLNFADLSIYLAVADNADAPLLAGAGLLLLLVFGLKAALFPLYFWLPRSYAAASAPVAALFAIMSKVGIYALLRLTTLLFAAGSNKVLFAAHAGSDNALGNLLLPWLWPLSIATLLLGSIGALAASSLQQLTAYLVIVSVGTLSISLALHSVAATTALLYYLLHSTWIGGALFLLAGLIATQRGAIGTQFKAGPALRNPQWLGIFFLIAALALAGVPPLSGFIGKLLVLQATPPAARIVVWSAILLGSLATLIALIRAGSVLFWQSNDSTLARQPLSQPGIIAIVLLLATSVALSVGGGPIIASLQITAQQLFDSENYTAAVMSQATPQLPPAPSGDAR